MSDVRFKLGFVSLEVRWWIVLACVLGLALSPWVLEALLVPLAYLSLLLHEIGHAAYQRRTFGAGSQVRIFGLIRGRTTSLLPRPPTPDEQIAYSLTGPLVGIAFGLVCAMAAIALTLGWVAVTGCFAIVALHVFNLLPFKAGSDGSVIRQALGKDVP